MKKVVAGVLFLFFVLAVCGVSMAEDKTQVKKAEPEQKTTVILNTNQGKIIIKLMPQAAPLACQNFTKLVDSGYYDNIIFHRVVKGFMIQGGDPTGTGRGGASIWGRPFKDEVNEGVKFDKKGLVAMANSGPNTNGSQFFITTAQTPWLNMRHTIFGEVVSGYKIVEKIEAAEVDKISKPVKEQVIKKAYLK